MFERNIKYSVFGCGDLGPVFVGEQFFMPKLFSPKFFYAKFFCMAKNAFFYAKTI